MKFRKKPVVIEATQWFKPGDHPKVIPFREYERNHKVAYPADYTGDEHVVETLEGYHVVSVGDWIITGVKGEHYPCKPDVFERTYEKVEE